MPIKPLARASERWRLGLPAPTKPMPNLDGLSWYQRNRTAVLARQRAAYQLDPTKQLAAVRASQTKLHQSILQTGIVLGRLLDHA